MTYATAQDLRRRFGDADMNALADPDNTGLSDDAVLEAALADSDEEINGYIAAAGYALPLPVPVPNSVRYVATDIAHYRLYRAVAPKQVEDKYKYGVQWLRYLAQGSVKLIGADGKELPRASADAGGAVSGKPATLPVVDAVFTPQVLQTFVTGSGQPAFDVTNPFELRP